MKVFTHQNFLKKNLSGFTLIETIVAIFVFTLAMGAVSGFIVMAYRIHSYTWQQSIAIDEARRGIEIMVKEIREARTGDDGSYPIEYSGDKEFIFYSDIDKDDAVERVRYFLATAGSGQETKECETLITGGFCSVSFSNFKKGIITSAQVKVSVKGDFDTTKEYADIYTDGNYYLGTICKTNCTNCPAAWEGTQTYDVTDFASDGDIYFLASATSWVGPECPNSPKYSMKARFEFSWREDLTGIAHEFKKGVIDPVTDPSGKISYSLDQEKISLLTSYVRNIPPIFKYFDQNGEPIEELPARLKDTKVMEVYLVVNVDSNRPPDEFALKSAVQLRNLKEE